MQSTVNSSLSALTYFPIHPSWIEQSEAFFHEDSRIFKAYMKVLLAAWRGQPCGSVPSSFTYLAEVTGLPVAMVEECYGALTGGFELLSDKRFHHVQMSALGAQLQDRYGREIGEFALSTAMAVQEPDLFGVVCVEAATPKAKGKCSVPKNFGYTIHPQLSDWARENGYPTQEDQRWVMARFHDYCQAKAVVGKDWPATFRNWAGNELLWGRMPPSRQQSGRSTGPDVALDRRPSFSSMTRSVQSKGDQAAADNEERLGKVFKRGGVQ